MNPNHLKELVIIPALKELDMNSEWAVNLLLGTAAVESNMGKFLKQVKGPALGIYQIEPNTYFDVYTNYLDYRPELCKKVDKFRVESTFEDNLIWNLYYATMIARLIYYRADFQIPENPNDIRQLAKIWKKYYNTTKGAHTEQFACATFIEKYHKYVMNEMHYVD